MLSLVLLILVIAVLSFVFFLLNRPRRFEVGILKSWDTVLKILFGFS